MTEIQSENSGLSVDDWCQIMDAIPEETPMKNSLFRKIEIQLKEASRRDICKLYPPEENYRLWDVLLAWRDDIHASNKARSTKRNYLAGVSVFIEMGILDPEIKLRTMTEEWRSQVLIAIDKSDWSLATKKVRKSCLEDFLKFANGFRPSVSEVFPALIIPPKDLVHHVLTSMEDKLKAQELSADEWQVFFDKIYERHARDWFICHLALHTCRTISEVLNLVGINITDWGIRWNDGSDSKLFKAMIEVLRDLAKENPLSHIFLTDAGKKIMRNQIVRTMKKASKASGLPMEVTPKLLQGYAISLMEKERRSGIERLL